jgi:hypothetical protein
LDISKIEAGKIELEHKRMDLEQVVQAMADTFKLEAEKRGSPLKQNFLRILF